MAKNPIDMTRKKLYYSELTDSVQKIAGVMHKKKIHSILVKDIRGKMAGIITVGDILRKVERNYDCSTFSANDIMSSPVVTIGMDATVDDIVNKFQKEKVTRLVMLDKNNEPIGIMRDTAVYNYQRFTKYDAEAAERLSSGYRDHFY
ncbi:MAG: CBS domain-containing protein [Nanoarchaeota archaeon]|nr:CBS domain-containing protein [Nanoarchaeota archaeon]